MAADNHMLEVPQMLLIGAFGRNSGKTTLACQLIKAWKETVPIYALKVIGIDRANGGCHRGEAGCGICSSLCGSYEICEETGEFPDKDTALMLAAGARKAFLLKSLRGCMDQAVVSLLAKVPDGTLVIAESNSLRIFVVPGAFVFAGFEPEKAEAMKQSARAVFRWADFVINPDEGHAAEAFCIRRNADGSVGVRPV